MKAIHQLTTDVNFFHAFAPQAFSKFDVLETGFWDQIFGEAKKCDTAQAVLNTMEIIVNEPCYEESDRVCRMVDTAIRMAQRTLSLH